MPIVSLLKTENMHPSTPKAANLLLRCLLLPLGGGEFYFCTGEKLAIIADVTLPAAHETGANFDLRLAVALINIARDEGVSDITLCLRPEGFDLDLVLERSGYGKLKEMPGLNIVGLGEASATPRCTDTALVLEQAQIYDVLTRADIIISLAKFRTAEGKLFGSALNNIAYAARPSSNLSFTHQQRALVDICSIFAPDLTIVDCLRGQSGFQNNRADCLLAGSDAVALDTVLAAIAGIDAADSEAILLAGQYGVGVNNPLDITMYGDDLREIMASSGSH